jgi:hypothetical protein
MIETGLSLERYSFEAEEWHVAFRARNGDTAGAVEVYIHPGEVHEWGEQLVAFGTSVKDEARFEFGSREGNWAYYLLVRAFIVDSAGHAAIEFAADNRFDPPYGAGVRLFIPCEVASVNRLGRHVQTWARDGSTPLVWSPTP